ncbi:MAG: AraC family transcriptional regulator [Lachnospiraceae bacterium]|nr:AraC family transcriptional regulator [Lachnospiraceae bacterium]
MFFYSDSLQPNTPANLRADHSEKVEYNEPDFYAYIREGSFTVYPEFSAINHWHEDVEFIYVIRGEMEYHVDAETIRLSAHEGLFVNAKHFHYGCALQGKTCDFVCIILHPILLCITAGIERAYVDPLTHHRGFPYQKLTRDVDWTSQVLHELSLLYEENRDQIQKLLIQSRFYRIWDLLFRHMPPRTDVPDASGGQFSLLKDMVHFIEGHYPEKITVEDIAKEGHLSVSKCYDLFHRFLGKTPMDYLNRYRLDQSIRLMSETDLSMTEITGLVGFTGSSYYASLFRKTFGCTPSAYRKQLS